MRKATAVSVLLLGLVLIGAAIVGYFTLAHGPSNTPRAVVRPTGTVLMAVRDLARLETNELHMEKVVDLTDKQSRFFGMLDSTDAILLVAAGDVTVGIDLKKL